MNKLLPIHSAKEYATVAILLALVSVFGVISTFIEDDFILIISTAIVIIGALFFLENVEPVHFLYALCLGVSFLPYINLQMFPLSGVYVVAMLFVLLSGIAIFRSKESFKISTPAKWMIAFLAIASLSIIVAPDKKAVVVYGGQFLLYILIYIVTANSLDSKPKIVRALSYIIYGSVIVLLISLFQIVLSLASIDRVVNVFFETIIGEFFIGSNGIERIGDSAGLILNRGSNIAEASNFVLFRVFGPFEGPTIFGWYLLVIGLLVGGLYVVQFKKGRIGLPKLKNAVLFLLIIFCLVFTWTRSALLGFIFAFSFIMIYRNKKSIRVLTPGIIRIITCLGIIFVAIIILLLLFQVPLPIEIFTQLFSYKNLGGSTVARLLTIFFAVSYIVQNPVMGIGFGNYKYAQPGVDASAGEASFASAHNTYLELGVELGLPGLIIFIVLIYSFVKQTNVLVKAPVGNFFHTLGIIFMAIWLGFAFVSFFGGNLIHPRFMTLLWVLAGIQTASYYLYIDDKKKEDTVYRLKVAD